MSFPRNDQAEIRSGHELKEAPLALLLDAAGTLIRPAEPVGHTYARVARAHGILLEPGATDAAFAAVWRRWPPPARTAPQPSPDDDRGWWRNLVGEVFTAAGAQPANWRERFPDCFEALFGWFGEGAAWQLYADARLALDRWHRGPRLVVVSNFDRRLRGVLADLGVADRFERVVLSSEVGAAKPDPLVFETAVAAAGVAIGQCLHVGDDRQRDIAGARAIGLRTYRVRRPGSDLARLADLIGSG